MQADVAERSPEESDELSPAKPRALKTKEPAALGLGREPHRSLCLEHCCASCCQAFRVYSASQAGQRTRSRG